MKDEVRDFLNVVSGLGWQMPVPRTKIKQSRKCLLPECNIMHTHNGGYCCAGHCREHLRRLKNREVVGSAS